MYKSVIAAALTAGLRRRRIRWSVVSRPELAPSEPVVRDIVERLLQGNPVVPYYLRTHDAQAVTISDLLTRRHVERSCAAFMDGQVELISRSTGESKKHSQPLVRN